MHSTSNGAPSSAAKKKEREPTISTRREKKALVFLAGEKGGKQETLLSVFKGGPSLLNRTVALAPGGEGDYLLRWHGS